MTFKNLSLAAALGFILGAVGLGFLPLLWLGFGQGAARLDSYLLRVVVFTLEQALLSTVLSVAIALPVARALARRGFAGRDMLLKIFSVPLALPAIVAILGIVGIYGNVGLFPGIFPIYGLAGIVFAHVFFNMPLAVRLMLTRLDAIPAENFRLAAQLNLSGGQVFRFIEWPQLATAITGSASLIFLLCTASFAVVLILGGGPQATTLEVAIYQSLRLDFDPARASILALAQLATCGVLVFVAGQFATEQQVFPPTLAKKKRWDGKSEASRLADGLAIALGMLIVAPPILSVVFSGAGSVHVDSLLLRATATSLLVGLASASISLALGWVLAGAAARQQRRMLKSAITLVCLASLILPPAVLATGWFVGLSYLGDASRFAIILVITLNALMALPFVWPPLYPAIMESAQRHDRLCSSLGLSGWPKFSLVDLPVLRRPLALAFLMAVIVSLGDLSAITLFGSAELVTLPALIFRQMGHYRMNDAAGTAFVLAAFCFLLIALAQKWSRGHDQA